MDTQEQSAIITDISRPDKDGKCKLSVKYLKRDGTPLDFPTAYQGVADSLLKDFNPGDQVTVVTKKGRPKENVKPENQGDERKAFWWDFQAIRKGAAPAAPGSSTAPAPGQPAAEGPRVPAWDARNTSIERQVALKAAVEVVVAFKGYETAPEAADAAADLAGMFAAWIAGTPQEQAQGAVVEPKAAPAFEDLGPASTGPMSADVRAALARNDYSVFWPVTRNLGYKLVYQVATKLGMMPDDWLVAAPGRTLADAVKLLESH